MKRKAVRVCMLASVFGPYGLMLTAYGQTATPIPLDLSECVVLSTGNVSTNGGLQQIDPTLITPAFAEMVELPQLLQTTLGVSNLQNPAEYLGFAETLVDGLSIVSQDPQTLETTFLVQQLEATDVSITIAEIAEGEDRLDLTGDLDGVNFTGSVVRQDGFVIVTIEPNVLGVGLIPRLVVFAVRQRVVTPAGGGEGFTLGEPVLLPTQCDLQCVCGGGTGACTPDDCYQGNACNPTPPPGECLWVPAPDGSSTVPAFLGMALLSAATVLSGGIMACRRRLRG